VAKRRVGAGVIIGPCKHRTSGRPRNYRTRIDPFKADWPQMCEHLETDPDQTGLELFACFQARNPDRYKAANSAPFSAGSRHGEPKLPGASSSESNTTHSAIRSGNYSRVSQLNPRGGEGRGGRPASPHAPLHPILMDLLPRGDGALLPPLAPPSVTSYVRQPVTSLGEATRRLKDSARRAEFADPHWPES